VSSHSALQRTDDAVLYGAAYVATVATTLGLTMTVGSPDLSWQAIAFVTVGFATSWLMNARKIRSRALPYLILVVALAASSPWWGHPSRFASLVPRELIDEWDYRVAGVMFLFMALRTFSLLSRGDLMFGVVPGLSVFGVMAHRGVDADYIFAFLVFVLASTYLVAYDHLLDLRSGSEPAASPQVERALRWDHLIATTALCMLCLAAAGGASLALRLAGERYRASVLGGITVVAPRPIGHRSGWTAGGDRVLVGAGPVELSDREVLRVVTRTPGNWRQRVYDNYYGRGWSMTPKPQDVPAREGAFDFKDLLDFRRQRGEPERCRVYVMAEQPSDPGSGASDIISAAPPTELELHLLRPRLAPRLAYLDRHGTVTLGEQVMLQPGDWYQVTGQHGVEVKAPGAQKTVRIRSLTLPSHYSPEYSSPVRRLVETLVQDATDDLGKVRAIEDYLLENCRYNARAAAVPRTERDVVEVFLFKSQEGYCDLFASAVCVMCRIAGIPARFAVGYAPGDYDQESRSFVVRERDRHAWAEVFVRDVGWVTVDPAAGAAAESRSARGTTWLSAIGRSLRRYARPLGVVAVVVLMIYLLVRLRPSARRRIVSPRIPRGPSSDVVGVYRRGCRLLDRLGRRRQPWQTALEYAAACREAPAVPITWQAFQELTRLFLKARYGREGAAPADVQAASAALGAMRHSLRGPARGRLRIP